MRRIPMPRLAGLVVATAIAAAAAQLLAHAFDTGLLIDAQSGDAINRWVERAPTAGSGIVGGGLLVLIAAVVVSGVLRHRARATGTITTRRRGGATRIDRRSLADALERALEPVDQRADIRVTIRRRGRADLRIITPDPTRTGTANDVRQRLDAICAERSLPVRSGRVTTSTPRNNKGRRRVR